MIGGKKFDDKKLMLDLIPPEAIDALGEVLTYGESKYGRYNWSKGIVYSRLFAAIMRHLWAYWKGENLDSESGISHLKHAFCNIAFLITYTERGIEGLDDRYDINA